MSMDFSPEVEAKIQKWVESGRYSDANAVVGEAMRLLIEHERLEHQRTTLDVGRQDELHDEMIEVAPEVESNPPPKG